MKPIILTSFGRIQVLCYEECINDIFWYDTHHKTTCGPFKSVYDAMRHYTQSGRETNTITMPKNNVVALDFKTKRRV